MSLAVLMLLSRRDLLKSGGKQIGFEMVVSSLSLVLKVFGLLEDRLAIVSRLGTGWFLVSRRQPWSISSAEAEELAPWRATVFGPTWSRLWMRVI